MSRTCCSVIMAVMFSLRPLAESFLITSFVDSPLVFVMGIFTYTLEPHWEMIMACLSISAMSSAKTSKEKGLSGTSFRMDFANAA